MANEIEFLPLHQTDAFQVKACPTGVLAPFECVPVPVPPAGVCAVPAVTVTDQTGMDALAAGGTWANTPTGAGEAYDARGFEIGACLGAIDDCQPCSIICATVSVTVTTDGPAGTTGIYLHDTATGESQVWLNDGPGSDTTDIEICCTAEEWATLQIVVAQASHDGTSPVTAEITVDWVFSIDGGGCVPAVGLCDADIAAIGEAVALAVTQPDPCLSPTGVCRCYGDPTAPAGVEYVNDDNTTDITASQNLTTLKWQTELGQHPDADAFGPAIAACIASGETAHITWTDVNGTAVTFDATTVLADGAVTGEWAFTGTGAVSWSGKVDRAALECGDPTGTAGVACLWAGCDPDGHTITEWRDETTLAALTPADIATLTDCGGDCVNLCPDCPTETVSVVLCADGDQPPDATDGDRILLVGVRDCEGALVSASAVNLTAGNVELGGLPDTVPCEPEPQVEEIRECVVDTAGRQWTMLVIVEPDGTQSDPIFVAVDTLTLGVPAGDPSEWASCVEGGDVELKDACFYDRFTLRRVTGCERLLFDTAGNLVDTGFVIGSRSYSLLPDHLRGPFDCDACVTVAGCFDPRVVRFNSVLFTDGTTIDLDALYGVDAATTNDVITEVVAHAGGTGGVPTEYSTPPAILCAGTNLHEFQFAGLTVGVVSIESTVGTFDAESVGPCTFDPPAGLCGGTPAVTDELTLTPGGSADGGACDDDLLAVLQPVAGVKQQIKTVKAIRVKRTG